jgi:hypothetical protein
LSFSHRLLYLCFSKIVFEIRDSVYEEEGDEAHARSLPARLHARPEEKRDHSPG